MNMQLVGFVKNCYVEKRKCLLSKMQILNAVSKSSTCGWLLT